MTSPEATLARAVAEALLRYAEERDGLRSAADVVDVAKSDLPDLRGPRQRQLVDLLLGATGEGKKTGELAAATGMDQPNVYNTLQGLERQGLVERVPGSDPQRWRLDERFRARTQVIELASLVRPGEVTTYGAISQVVFGHARGGLAVASVARGHSDFPNPHRVVAESGVLHPGWRSAAGAGVEECASLLREEGVPVHEEDGHWYVAATRILTAEALQERMSEVAAS